MPDVQRPVRRRALERAGRPAPGVHATALPGLTLELGYYIYYQVDPGQAPDAEARVRAMQARLDARTGVAGRLLRKRDEPLLWMEVYEYVYDPERFEAALAELVAQHALESLLAPGSRRSTECFVIDEARDIGDSAVAS